MLKTSLIIKTTILLLAPAALAFNLFFFHSIVAGVIFGIAWLGVSCILWGSIFAPARERFEQVAFGLVAVLVIIILAGTTCFRLAVFNNYVIIGITFFIPLAGYVILFLRTKRQPPADIKPESQPIHTLLPLKKYLVPTLLNFAYLTLFAISINLILNHRTDASIRSPWEVLPHSLLYLYALATFILFFLFSRKEKTWTNERVGERGWLFALIILHFFLTLSLALLTYKVGYGFDPFIHRATEKIIFETGSLTPPPLSYLGQYVLVVFLSKVTLIPLPLIDLWLLPILASILVPLTGLLVLKCYPLKTNNYPLLTTLSLLILPLSLFIATVPQSLANLFYLILVLLSLSHLNRRVPLSLLWGIAFCIIFIHPITGIPALIFLLLFSFTTSQPRVAAFRREDCLSSDLSERVPQQERRYPRRKNRARLYGIIIITIMGALGLPAAIMVANKIYGGTSSLSTDTLPLPNLFPHYLPFLSLAHTGELWMRALPFLFFICTLGGTYLFMRRKLYKFPLVVWLTALVLFINYLFIRTLPLTAIIAYERPEFTTRILTLIALTLFPFFLVTLQRVWGGWVERLKTILQPRLLIAVLFLTSLITISFYYTYPRVDAFSKSRGFSVSQSDIDTAHWINDDSGSEPYVVLSNQSVAAAALQELGFKQYYNTTDCKLKTDNCKLFFYPIPTSSPLYQYYLDMVYHEAARATMEQAMDLVGVRRAYFVLNAYWLDTDKIAARASMDADNATAIGTTKVFVYKKR